MSRNHRGRNRFFARPLRLEDRLAPANFTVTTAGDGLDMMGNPVTGTLRWAIALGNDTAAFGTGPNIIDFNLPGPSLTISLSTALPPILVPTTVNGRTQPGYAQVPIIELSGQGFASSFDGLYMPAGNSTVQGLIVNGFGNGNGLRLAGPNNVVVGNYIGTDRTGKVAALNGWGVRIDDAENCVIGGTTNEDRNVISGNNVHGIMMGATAVGNNKIVGNYIGVDVTGDNALGNVSSGLDLVGPNYTIGGKSTGSRNIISGNGRGINLALATGSKIEGNFVGTNSLGSAMLGNSGDGIYVESSSSVTIGGTTDSARNLISGNGGTGLAIVNCGLANITVQANYIGTDFTGESDFGNKSTGLFIHNSGKILVGGASTTLANVISGNGTHGVAMDFVDAPPGMGNLIQGNFIGTNKDGQKNIGNDGDGVFLLTVKNQSIIGNVIADNGGNGIFVGFNSPYGTNTFQGNVIGYGPNNLGLDGNSKHGVEIIGSSVNLIGGMTSGQENWIAGNLQAGVHLSGATFGNSVQSNNIVANKSNGILIDGGAKNNLIGGSAGLSQGGNFIQLNGETLGIKGHGIEIVSGAGNAIRRNTFSENYGRGIDLNNDSFDINDPAGDNPGGKDDAKANKLQDYPVVIARSAGADGIATTTWRLDAKPNTNYVVEFFQNTTIDPSGFGEGIYIGYTSFTTNAAGVHTFDFFVPGFKLLSATATETFIDPMTSLLVGNTSEFSMIDIDCDGAADAWETMGIDFNEDGTIDLVLGTKADHKDLFVEVDGMAGFSPVQADLDLVIEAFENAPANLVRNPDESKGITLHATLDETELPNKVYTVGAGWAEFDVDKNGTAGAGGYNGHFGKLSERLLSALPPTLNPNWPNIRGARKLVYRYCLFVEGIPGQISGLTEGVPLSGAVNDFMVSLPPNFWGPMSPTSNDWAGTFMHELGHTLNLEHGGNDTLNYKPNYFSVMNYAWQAPNIISRTTALGLANYGPWVLDYSREQLPTLDENKLVEATGIQAVGVHAGDQVAYGRGDAAETILAPAIGNATGVIDWNRDGILDADPTHSVAGFDINFNGSAMDKLSGFVDWSNLQYYFVESIDMTDGVHGIGRGADEVQGNLPPAKVVSVVINDGTSLQRSRIDSVTVNFDQYVTFTGAPETAFEILKHGSMTPVALTASVGGTPSRTSVTLTFNGAGGQFGSLADGRYTLTVFAASVANVWGNLDGNGDGLAGGDYVMDSAVAPSTPTNIYRLFGDGDGNGTVSAVDFALFRSFFGLTGPSIFDFNNDTMTNANDFAQFRARFGLGI